MKEKRTLVWDVDDVLNDLMRDWFDYEWRASHPECEITYDDLKCNPPHDVLGITLSEYLASIDVFRASPRGLNLTPVPEVLGWFDKHGTQFRHLALTARPLESTPVAAEWVFRHFGRWIRGFGFVPSPRAHENLPTYDDSKADWLRWCAVDGVLIDDSPRNLAGARSLGMQAIEIPRPWNNASGTISDALDRVTALGASFATS
jgi:hypothetical protein